MVVTATVGSIVQYLDANNITWAAIVTRVNDDGTHNLYVLVEDSPEWKKQVSPGAGAGQWAWPA